MLGWPIWAYTHVIYIHRFQPACRLGTFSCLGCTQGQQTICYCCRLPTSQKPPGLNCLLQKQDLLSYNAVTLSHVFANACWGLAAAAGNSNGHQTVALCSAAAASSAHIVRIVDYANERRFQQKAGLRVQVGVSRSACTSVPRTTVFARKSIGTYSKNIKVII